MAQEKNPAQPVKEKATIKAINFDLDGKALRTQGFSKVTAYNRIKTYLKKHGFSHNQWSGYISKRKMTYARTGKILTGLLTQNPWLLTCIRDFKVTEYNPLMAAQVSLQQLAGQAAAPMIIQPAAAIKHDDEQPQAGQKRETNRDRYMRAQQELRTGTRKSPSKPSGKPPSGSGSGK